MKKKIYTIFVITILIFFNFIITVNSDVNKIDSEIYSHNLNKQIYLGYATIIGNGNSSELIANLENDLLIKLNTTNSIVDFYIEYNMTCNGLTDEGIITLTILLNDENISFNLVQTPNMKEGLLKVENIEIKNRDALGFRVDVAYASLIPLYSDSISATGFGIVNKERIFPYEIIFRNSIIFSNLIKFNFFD